MEPSEHAVSPSTTVASSVAHSSGSSCHSRKSRGNTPLTSLPPVHQSSGRLHRKLRNLETTITELLSLKRATGILKEKLAQIDELILDLPEEDAPLAAQWRIKVASWWRMYATYPSVPDLPVQSSASQSQHQLASIGFASPTTTSPFQGAGQGQGQHQAANRSHHRQNLGKAATGTPPTLAPIGSGVLSGAPEQSPSWLPTAGPAGTLPQSPPSTMRSHPKPIGSRPTVATGAASIWPLPLTSQVAYHHHHHPSPVTSTSTVTTVRKSALTYAQVSQMRHPSRETPVCSPQPRSPGAAGSLGPTVSAHSPGGLALAPLTPMFGASPTLPSFPDTSSYNSLTGPVTAGSVRRQLEAAFASLANVPESESTSTSTSNLGHRSIAFIDGLQKLLAAVAKAIKAISPFVQDETLLLEVSRYAIAKMPTEKQAEFRGRYERWSLFNLMRFLRKEIVLYYEKYTNTNQELAPYQMWPGKMGGDDLTRTGPGDSFSGEEQQHQQVPYCVYCRHEGHRVHECPIKRGMLCFKCYEFGHTLKCCPNATLINIK